ncbi:hypothetical protein KI387_022076, partial [Taxus chinensis]
DDVMLAPRQFINTTIPDVRNVDEMKKGKGQDLLHKVDNFVSGETETDSNSCG